MEKWDNITARGKNEIREISVKDTEAYQHVTLGSSLSNTSLQARLTSILAWDSLSSWSWTCLCLRSASSCLRPSSALSEMSCCLSARAWSRSSRRRSLSPVVFLRLSSRLALPSYIREDRNTRMCHVKPNYILSSDEFLNHIIPSSPCILRRKGSSSVWKVF